MGWGKALSAVIVISISVMLVVSVLPVGADPGSGNNNGKSPLMFRSGDCSLDVDAKCAVYIDHDKDGCDEHDKMIMLPAKAALKFEPC